MSVPIFSSLTFAITCHLAKPVITRVCVTFMQQLMPHPENRLLIAMPETQNGAEAERLTATGVRGSRSAGGGAVDDSQPEAFERVVVAHRAAGRAVARRP